MTTIANPTQTQTTRNPIILAHLLSLDAPAVAALWTWFLARTLHVPMRLFAPASMFLAVWALYAADRLLDSRNPDSAALEARHRFHAAHHRAFLSTIVLALSALILTLPHAQSFLREWLLILALTILLAAWLTLVHTRARPLPKEFAVGIFFAAAVSVPSAPAGRLLIAPALAFTAVCILNGLFIHAWEHPDFRTAPAHPLTLAALRSLRPLALVAAAVPVLLIPRLDPRATPALLAAALAALAMAALDQARFHLSRTTLRALADLTLLTPLILLPLPR